MEIISCKEAKRSGLKDYFTGKPCKRGHVSPRDVKTRNCRECKKIVAKDYYENNLDYIVEYRRDRKDIHAVYRKNHYEDNKEWYTGLMRDWRISNPDIVARNSAQWRADRQQRTLDLNVDSPIYELDEICKQEIYKQSRELSDSGTPHHVDHVVPLKGETVSGLHIWYNLEVTTAEDNKSKFNKFTPYWENHITGEIQYA